MPDDDKTPSAAQVRAWLSTVLTPWLDALRIEAAFPLKSGTETGRQVGAANGSQMSERGREAWSFRGGGRKDFEFVRPTLEAFSPHFLPNVEQFLDYHLDLKALAEGHDRALERLRTAYCALYACVLLEPTFLQRVRQDPPPGPEEDALWVLAQYWVNGAEFVPEGNRLSEYWNRHALEFLRLGVPGCVEHIREANAASAAFQRERDELRGKLEALRRDLARQYRLPPVEPLDAELI